MSKIQGLKIVDDHHFQDRKRKGLVKDDPDVWKFIYEYLVGDYHLLNGNFLFKFRLDNFKFVFSQQERFVCNLHGILKQ